jgi:hypothetical protein
VCERKIASTPAQPVSRSTPTLIGDDDEAKKKKNEDRGLVLALR